MKDKEFDEIPQEPRRCFAEAGQEKVFSHLPVPLRLHLHSIGPAVQGLIGDGLKWRLIQIFAILPSEFSESWYRSRKGLASQLGLILTREHLIPNA